MAADQQPANVFESHNARREKLVQTVTEKYKTKNGAIVLFAGFEGERTAFRQESSFYYYTGIEEPGVVLVMELSGKTTLYIPNCGTERAKWIFSAVPLEQKNAKLLGVETIVPLGKQCVGYQFHPFFPREEYTDLLDFCKKIVEANGHIYTLNSNDASSYCEQRLVLQRMTTFVPELKEAYVDISDCVAAQRCTKDMQEIELMYRAVDLTAMAHEAAAQAIEPGMTESEVQATIEYVMKAAGERTAFPSIVAGGKNSTVLHYMVNRDMLKKGDLVVVDIGAEFQYYAADLTRTYPVSGTFTKRQREVYTAVLETQEYIAAIARPGYWLSNKDNPEKSLHHLAKAFLKERGLDQYFTHGIGHYLGLEVHDVGDYTRPLQEGDVFTIEPGVYIPEENIGIRIEDDYWMVEQEAVCLSEQLPKQIKDIERFVQQGFSDDEDVKEGLAFEFDEDDDDAGETAH